jgi:hypothetical protein
MTSWVPARAGAALAGLCLLLGACGDGDFRDDAQDVAEATDDAVPEHEPELEPDESDEADDAGAEPEGGDDGGPGDEVVTLETARATDGTWAILDAGTVTFRVVDDGLELLDVSPAAGWDASVEDESDRKLTVELSADRRTYELRAERRGRDLRIEVSLDVDGAEPGPFAIGGAGTLRLDVDGDDLRAELEVIEGWTVHKEDHDDDEVEVELRSDDLRWRVAAEVDDGRIDITADLRVEGRVG